MKSSHEFRRDKLCARRWAIIFWQGEHGLGYQDTGLCPTATEYYERQYIKNLESEYECQLNEAIKSDTLLAALRVKSLDAAITLTRLLYHYNPLNWEKKPVARRYI